MVRRGASERAERPERDGARDGGADGRPHVRMVLLKGHGPDGFVFYTNEQSAKGEQLRDNPRARLCCFTGNPCAGRSASKARSSESRTREADAYFATRSRDSQLGAWASDQSRAARQPRDIRAAVRRGKARASKARTCRARRTGAAIASSRSASNSGATGRTACTSGGCSRARRRLERRAALPMSDGAIRQAERSKLTDARGDGEHRHGGHPDRR